VTRLCSDHQPGLQGWRFCPHPLFDPPKDAPRGKGMILSGKDSINILKYPPELVNNAQSHTAILSASMHLCAPHALATISHSATTTYYTGAQIQCSGIDLMAFRGTQDGFRKEICAPSPRARGLEALTSSIFLQHTYVVHCMIACVDRV
jgi:hypothetical protein